ncbi:oligosaccharyl transferase glycoprotein complex, beta subunit [Dimargaris verticillata]|uniref:Dolichyl-diphosphooligosaccharide--protein glycosyltransferase subunit WBP1 n=1 Tax=Dimargaris verticillata TaxID=2761393 RepID=A0A9W8B5E8_9FUNG|nr:oligosaccharyl transferase glycoprotein complex, beta subunit [Dimargaris verticillata]
MATTTDASTLHGPRMRKLCLLLDKSLTTTVGTLTYERLAECFPYLAQESPQLLRTAQGQVSQFMRATVENEFQTIVQQRHLVEKLNQLDQFIEKARASQTDEGIGPLQYSCIDPETAVRARTMKLKQAELAQLKEIYAKWATRNEALMASIKDKRRAMHTAKRAVVDNLQELQQVAQAGQAMDTDALAKDVRVILLFQVAALTSGLIVAAWAKSLAGDRTLVLLPDTKDQTVSQYGQFIDSLKGRGFQVTIDAATSSSAKVYEYDERQYDHLVLLVPGAKRFASGLDAKTLVEFVKDGGNVLVGAGSDFGGAQREFARQLGVEFDVRGNVVLDHFHYQATGSATDPAQRSQLVTDRFAAVDYILSDEVRQGGPVLFQGIGHRILPGPQETMVWPVLTGYDTTYSFDTMERRVVQPKDAVLAGTKLNLVSAFQSKNNARVALVGSATMFSNSAFDATVNSEGMAAGNKQFCHELSQWAFHEKGVLQVQSVAFRKLSDPLTANNPSAFRIRDEIEYRIELSHYANDQWRPIQLSDVQFEAIMLDPYIRKTLTAVDNTPTSTVFAASLQLPDVYGVFTFAVDYRRVGLSSVHHTDIVSILPFKHNEYRRFIPAAFPYYASSASLLLAFIAFSLVWLYNREPTEKKAQ